MRRAIVLSVVALMVVMLAATTFAYDKTGSLGLSYRFGLHTVMSDPWAMKFFHGAEAKFGLHPNVGIALFGTYARTRDAKLDFTGAYPAFVTPDENCPDELKLTNYIIGVAPVFNLMPYGRTNVYLTAGPAIGAWRVRDLAGNKVYVGDGKGGTFPLKDQQFTIMLGAGLEHFIIEEFSVGVSGRYYIFTDILSDYKGVTPTMENITGADGLDLHSGLLEFGIFATAYFGKCQDDDKDGVCNEDDNCPDTPENCIVDEFGCPIDTDGDGVCDGRDLCPDTPRGCKVDLNGCLLDSDADGVCDGVDKCPNTQQGCKVDAVGCALDEDQDGVPDCRDKCPGTPRCCKVNADGCELDGDNDGVCDGCDLCPGTPPGLTVDTDGCPGIDPCSQMGVLEDVRFATNLSVLRPATKKFLDDLVDALKARPHLTMEIQGHCDNTNGQKWNEELSLKRADAVKAYFVDKGLDASRFTTKGFGDTKPTADNSTAAGRAQNRRVVFNCTN